MKKNESKTKFNLSGKQLEPSCPACISGVDPTVITADFADALRESL